MKTLIIIFRKIYWRSRCLYHAIVSTFQVDIPKMIDRIKQEFRDNMYWNYPYDI